MRTQLVITNNGLGSDNTIFCEYNIQSHQGRARVEYWVRYLSDKQGKKVFVYTRHEWRDYGKPLKGWH